MRHLIDIADLSREEIIELMDEADRFRKLWMVVRSRSFRPCVAAL